MKAFEFYVELDERDPYENEPQYKLDPAPEFAEIIGDPGWIRELTTRVEGVFSDTMSRWEKDEPLYADKIPVAHIDTAIDSVGNLNTILGSRAYVDQIWNQASASNQAMIQKYQDQLLHKINKEIKAYLKTIEKL